MRKLLLFLCALLTGVSGAWAVETPTFTETAPVSVTGGWYQIKWIGTNSDTNTNYTDEDVSGKFVTNYSKDVTVGEKCYSLFLGDVPTTLDEHAKTFVYYEYVGGEAGRGTHGNLRAANGHYVSPDGSSLLAAPSQYNYIIYFSSSTYPNNSVITSHYSTAPRYSLIPMGKGEEFPYIGQTAANKFPMVQFSPVSPADLGLQPWTVTIEGLTETIAADNVQVEYKGADDIYGLTSVYANGVFFLSVEANPVAGDFSAPEAEGKTPNITVDATEHKVSVVYGNIISVTYELYEADGTTLVKSLVVRQDANTEISIPTSFYGIKSSYEAIDYEYNSNATTVGDADCTIKVTRTLKENGFAPSLADGAFMKVGEAANTMIPATSATDNSHWYLITQNRGGTETPIYDVSTYATIKRAPASNIVSAFNNVAVSGNEQYLVRFIETGENTGLYYMQFADGNYIAAASSNRSNNVEIVSTQTIKTAGTFAFNLTAEEATTFGWRIDNNESTSLMVDNNGVDKIVLLWGTTISNTREWTIYPVELSVPSYLVQFEIRDANDNSVLYYKSDQIATSLNEEFKELPDELKRDYCSYVVTETKITSEGLTIVPATVTFSLPFTVSTSIDDATWYYAKLRGHNVYYSKDNNDVRANQTSLVPSDDYKWAFMGNPYEGIKVVNKATNTYLDNTDSTVKLSEGGYAWTIHEKDANTFGLYNGSNYINEQNKDNHNLIYWWNFSGDTGSQWTIEEAAAVDKKLLEDAIAEAQNLCSNAGKLGYITSEAATTLSTDISEAQAVYDNPAGDYAAAVKTLATAAAASEREFTPRTDKYYTITSARGSMVYESSHDESADADGNKFLWYTTELDNTDVNHLWGFIEKEGNYYMYNVGKKQFATVSTSGSYQLNDKGTWVFSDTPAYVTFDAGIENSVTMPNVRVRATIATTKETYSMSISTGYVGPVITYDAKGDGGIPMLLAESEVAVDNDITAAMTAKVEDVTPYRNALKEVIEGCKDVVIGTAIGRFTSKDNTFEAAKEDANSVYDNPSATRNELQTAASNLKAAVEGLTLNVPAAGLYRVMNAASMGYLRATEVTGELGEKQGVFADELNGNGANVIISLVEKEGKLYLCNQGYHFGWTDAGEGTGSKGFGNLTNNTDKYVNWLPGTADGQIAFSICYGNGAGTFAGYLTRGIYTVDTSNELMPVIAGTDYTKEAAQWIFEPVADAPEITISLHDGGDGVYYGTFCAPFDVRVDDFTEVYTLTLSEDGTELNLSDEMLTDVPAGTPVLLIAESDEATATIGDNYRVGAPSAETALTGSYLKTAITENDFVLGTDQTKVGFFHWEGTELAANHAYIKGNAEVKGYYLNLGETDGIRSIENGQLTTDNAIFNLNGQRISKAQKGIYIVNGKKTVIK